MLEVTNLDVSYGKIQALWNVSMEIKQGEIVALVGANGAGKTTVLNTISGVVQPTKGSVKFCGNELIGMKPHQVVEQGISQVPEGGKSFNEMSIKENLEMGAYAPSVWKNRQQTMQYVFDLFPRLKERESQLARTLSGGEKQMLAMGRGLMSKPKLVMFDELSYGLAPVIVLEVFKIVQMLRDQGITVLLIEQNVLQTMQIADRAYVLENGRMACDGECKELLKSDYVRKAYLGL